jgi:hypothetical protein
MPLRWVIFVKKATSRSDTEGWDLEIRQSIERWYSTWKTGEMLEKKKKWVLFVENRTIVIF